MALPTAFSGYSVFKEINEITRGKDIKLHTLLKNNGTTRHDTINNKIIIQKYVYLPQPFL